MRGNGVRLRLRSPRGSPPPSDRGRAAHALDGPPRRQRSAKRFWFLARLHHRHGPGGFVREWNPPPEHTFGGHARRRIGCRLGDLVVPGSCVRATKKGLPGPPHRREPDHGTAAEAAGVEEGRLDVHRGAGDHEGLDRGGKLFFTGTLRDLTEIVRAEEERPPSCVTGPHETFRSSRT